MTAISFAEPAEPAEPAAAAAPPEPAEPGTSSRWWRIDLLIPLVGVGALVVYGFRGFRGYLGGDLGLYVYAGQQFADGVPPYVGVLTRVGPLAQMIPGLGVLLARGLGISDVLGARILLCLVSVAAICLTYVLGRAVFSSRLIGLATAAAMLSFGGFNTYATNGPREKTPMVLFVICVLWAVHGRRWMTAGVFVSLAALCWQPAFLVGIAAGVTGILLDRGNRRRGLLRFAGGGAIPAALCVMYFAAVGAFSEFISGFLLINARYTEADSFFLEPRHDLQVMHHAYGLSLGAFCVGFAATLLSGLVALLSRRRTRDSENAFLITSAVAAVVGTVWTFGAYNNWPDLFVLLPFAALGIGATFSTLRRHLPVNVTVTAGLVWVVTATFFATQFSMSQSSHPLDREQRSVDTVVDDLPPNATFLSLNAPQVLVLAGETNPTRYQRLGHGLDDYMDDKFPQGLQGFGRWIARESPTVIVMHNKPKPWLRPTLRQYVLVGKARTWSWYLNRAVGPETIADVMDDLRAMHQGVRR
jgi:hypothetical protein